MRHQRWLQQGDLSPLSFLGLGVMEPVVRGVTGEEAGLPTPLSKAWPVALCTFHLHQRCHNNHVPRSNASWITQNIYVRYFI